jgi:hypothetical protein
MCFMARVHSPLGKKLLTLPSQMANSEIAKKKEKKENTIEHHRCSIFVKAHSSWRKAISGKR